MIPQFLRSLFTVWLTSLTLLALFQPSLKAASVVINEFMASNDSTLQDEDSDYSDWIELKNLSAAPVNLQGWSLTDTPANLTNWVFPSVQIASGGYLVVFASQKNRAIAGSELHTNFKLDSDGEFLALVQPGGTLIADGFDPAFPDLDKDESYGRISTITRTQTLVDDGSTCRILVPTNSVLSTNWLSQSGFDDSAWLPGVSPVGFDQRGIYETNITTDIETEMRFSNASCYFRYPFTVNSVSNLTGLSLDIRYDDGFVAYINGFPFASANAPGALTWDAQAASSHEQPDALHVETFDLLDLNGVMTVGTNILSIHGLNRDVGPFANTGFLIDPVLYGAEGASVFDTLDVATPGSENTLAAPDVVISPDGDTFSDTTTITMSAPGQTAQIRFTLDGSEPTASSSLYVAPFLLSSTTELRARAFAEDRLPSAIKRRAFVKLASDLVTFSSDLPLVIIDNFNGGDTDGDVQKSFHLSLFEPGGDGRTRLLSDATLATRAGVKERGSSTSGREKVSYTVETWNDAGASVAVSPFDMPAESDWILYGPYNFDRAMMRNVLIYELSNRTGNYAVKTRFVELFRNIDGGDLSFANDYRGVYVWMEKIKRDRDRVDVEKLSPSDTLEPAISGGYMFKIDRNDPGDGGFTAGGQALKYLYPKEEDMEGPYSAQDTWLKTYLNTFSSALNGAGFRDPLTGYRSFIDVPKTVDFFILNEFMTRNPDELRLSTYLHKPRGERFTFGPIWDFDRTMGSYDGRDRDPFVWTTFTWTYGWWNRFFDDPDFWQDMIDRWFEWRGDTLALSEINTLIDDLHNQLSEAQIRNYTKWTLSLSGNNWTNEVTTLRTWLSNRVEWCDDQFMAPPILPSGDGSYTPGENITLSSPDGGTLYYTTDGSDPRPPGGAGPAPGAFAYSGALTVSRDMIITARAWDGTAFGTVPVSAPWSAPVSRAYVNTPALLAVSELMYNPRPPTPTELNQGFLQGDFEYIELQNMSSMTGSLVSVELSDGVQFSFAGSPLQSIGPGERLLIVRNATAFFERYPNVPTNRVAGEFSGSLNDAGERIEITLFPSVGPPRNFTYNDARDWPQSADGAGHSLVPRTLIYPTDSRVDYGGHWRASAWMDGSPGEADPAPISDMLINEILAHTDYNSAAHPEYDSNDALELFNVSSNSVRFDDWFLSDSVDDLSKWRLPAGTALVAHGWAHFDEISGFHVPITNGFGLDKSGEQVFLSHLPGAPSNRVSDVYRFRGQPNGLSIGRFPDGAANWHPMTPTLGTTNAQPDRHVYISEIMYHPLATPLYPTNNTLDEYIEIYNPLDTTVDLWTVAGAWRIDGGIRYTFPAATTLYPGQRIVLVPFDPVTATDTRTAFETRYAIPPSGVTLMGPYAGNLDNATERITLERPQAPDAPSIDRSWIIVDETVYLDQSPWPTGTDGTGSPIQRIANHSAGLSPESWFNGFFGTPGSQGAVLAIASPDHGIRVFAPHLETLTVSIDSSQISNQISEVTFFETTNILCVVTQAPYTCEVHLPTPRAYTYVAVLQDDAGTQTSRVATAYALRVDALAPQALTEATVTLAGGVTGARDVDHFRFYWGESDGGMVSGAWDNAVPVTPTSPRSYSLALENLRPDTRYYYRSYAEADGQTAWSSNTVSFTTATLSLWSHRRSLTFPGAPDSPLHDFPILVKFSPDTTNFAYAQFASGVGHDLRFSDSGNDELLSYEIDHWDTNGASFVWVRIPNLSTNSRITAYWGYAPAAATAPTYTQNGSTWRADYEAVWHNNPDLSESRGRYLPAFNQGTVSAEGITGPARSFSGTNTFLAHGPSPAWYSQPGDLTLSLWLNPDNAILNSGTAFGTAGDSAGDDFYIEINKSPFVRKWQLRLKEQTEHLSRYQLGQWQLLSILFSNSTVYASLNDSPPVSVSTQTQLVFTTSFMTGTRAAPGQNFLGRIDDIRMSNVARSPAWLKAAYETVAENNGFTAYGNPVRQQTPTNVSDLDQDGLPDAWELYFFGSTNLSSFTNGDSDGLSDGEEFIAGTDPTNALSTFTLDVTRTNNTVNIQFYAREASGPGYDGLTRYYELQCTPLLHSNAWTVLPGMTNIMGQNQWHRFNTNAALPAYYRARTRLR